METSTSGTWRASSTPCSWPTSAGACARDSMPVISPLTPPCCSEGGLYQRMFERRSISTRRSYAVSVLVDGSASMLQPRRLSAPRDRRPWGLAAAMLGAWTLAAMCNELRVDFEVAIFNRAFAARVGRHRMDLFAAPHGCHQ